MAQSRLMSARLMRMSSSRRSFFKQSALATTGVFYIAKTSWAKSPGDAINVAVVGFGGRGGSHISGYKKLERTKA